MARQIVVDIVGDASKFNRAADGAVTKASTLGGGLKNIGKGIAVGAGIGAFNLLDSAVSSVIGSLGEMDQAFKDDQVSQVKLQQALKNNIPNWNGNAKGVEKYATAQGRLGFTDDEVRDSIGQLIGVTHDLAEAQDLNSLAQDLARSKGIDLATATDIVTKAHEGNGRALKGLGIDIGDAKTAAELLDAVQKNVKGSAEAWADTAEGRQQVASVKVQEAMEKIGGVVDKVAQVVLPALADAFVWITDTIIPPLSEAMDALGPVFEAIGKIAGVVFPVMGAVISVVFNGAVTVIKGVITVIGTLIGWLQTAVGWFTSLFTQSDKWKKDHPNAASMTPAQLNTAYHVGGMRAAGGPVLSGVSYLVGEHGPEILQMGRSSGSIIPNGKWGGGGGSSMVFNFNGPVFGDGPFLDDLTNRIAQRLRYASGR